MLTGGCAIERKRLGILFMVLSCVPYAALFAVPFMPLSTSESAVTVTVLIVLGETLFAIGGLIAGRSLLERFRSKLIPSRFRRKKPSTDSEE
jgi:hypothetical protein